METNAEQYLSRLTRLSKTTICGGLDTQEFFYKAGEVASLVEELAAAQRPVVYQWVDSTQVAAFQHYLDHYHDQQDEALQETSNDHYERWLDTAEPGDQYTVSENDHSLDPYEASFEVVHVDESEYGKHYQLIFDNTAAALHFGLGWGEKQSKLEGAPQGE
ncbi:MAG: hypothetical protein ACRYFZ_00645 [Janthinobacterium lividum]